MEQDNQAETETQSVVLQWDTPRLVKLGSATELTRASVGGVSNDGTNPSTATPGS